MSLHEIESLKRRIANLQAYENIRTNKYKAEHSPVMPIQSPTPEDIAARITTIGKGVNSVRETWDRAGKPHPFDTMKQPDKNFTILPKELGATAKQELESKERTAHIKEQLTKPLQRLFATIVEPMAGQSRGYKCISERKKLIEAQKIIATILTSRHQLANSHSSPILQDDEFTLELSQQEVEAPICLLQPEAGQQEGEVDGPVCLFEPEKDLMLALHAKIDYKKLATHYSDEHILAIAQTAISLRNQIDTHKEKLPRLLSTLSNPDILSLKTTCALLKKDHETAILMIEALQTLNSITPENAKILQNALEELESADDSLRQMLFSTLEEMIQTSIETLEKYPTPAPKKKIEIPIIPMFP